MDGLILVLIIIGWVINRTKKKNSPVNARRVIEKVASLADDLYQSASPGTSSEANAENQQDVTLSFSQTTIDGAVEQELEPAFEIFEPYIDDMPDITFEGEDICPPELGHNQEKKDWTPTEEKEKQVISPVFSLNSANLVNSIVMSEILMKPGDRKWGSRR